MPRPNFLSVAGILACACGAAPAPTSTVGTWMRAVEMPQPRAFHTMTVLASGLVLVAGGVPAYDREGNSTELAEADLYNPASGTWTKTGSMAVPRAGHAAVRLTDGRVLVVGGFSTTLGVPRPGDANAADPLPIASAEIYDPDTGEWHPTAPMHHPRLPGDAGAVLLLDGTVLVAGWLDVSDPTHLADPGAVVFGADTEIYDPVAGIWGEAGPISTARTGATMVRLGDGRVLSVGGRFGYGNAGVADADIYDPASRTWRSTTPFDHGVVFNTLTALPGGMVLLTSGCPHDNWPCSSPPTFESLETTGWLFDPQRETWTATSPTHFRRQYASAALLPSGRVLVMGGNSLEHNKSYTAPNAEIYDPARDTWTLTPVIPHFNDGWGAAAVLLSGEVLFTGGFVYAAIHEGPSMTYDNLLPIAAAQVYREQ